MPMKATVLTLMLLLGALATTAVGDDRIIARCDRVAVTERVVACSGKVRSSDPQLCRALEQQALRRALVYSIVDAAAAAHDLQPLPAERVAIDRKVAAALPAQERALRHIRTLLKQLLLVADSTTSADDAYAGLDPKEFPRQEFDADARTFDASDIRALLAQEPLPDLQRQLRESMILEIEARNLKEYIAAAAAREGRTAECVEAELWKATIATIHLQILSADYVMPSFEGVLERHEETIPAYSSR